MKNAATAQKLASLLLDYLRSTNQTLLPPNLVRDLHQTASREDEANTVYVTSAVSLNPAEREIIKAYVKRKTGELRKIDYSLDKSLIAGFTLRIGDELLDASLSSKLAALKDHLVPTN